MNILQFNVRLAEGGAAGVALDLHQRALQQGLANINCLWKVTVHGKSAAVCVATTT